MAWKYWKELLSRLLGRPAKEQRKEEDPLQRTADAKAETPVQPAPDQLSLPTEHAVNQLWRLRQRQSGWLPPPVLRLKGPEEEEAPVDPENLSRELGRLQSLVSASAGERWKQAHPPKRKEQTEPNPPPDLDAKAVVFVPKDGLSAWLLVYPPVGEGKEADRSTLTAALEASKVSFGVDEALLDRLPQ